MPDERFEFDLCKNVCDVERRDIRDCSLIWTRRQALLKEVWRTWSEDLNLRLSLVLIMLFLLGFPRVRLRKYHYEQVVSLGAMGG